MEQQNWVGSKKKNRLDSRFNLSKYILLKISEMAERLKAAVLKTAGYKSPKSSNLLLAAKT